MLWQGWDLVEVTSWHVPVLAVSVALGMLAHVAGDMLTHDGCPLLYPFSRYEFGLLPEPIRITTNKLAERWVLSPLLLGGLGLLRLARRGHALTTATSAGWPCRADGGAPKAGERIVFLGYTREVFAATQAWTRRVFPALPEAAPSTRQSCPLTR